MTDDDEPLGHLLRRNVPWRESTKTECGRAATDVAKVITRDEAESVIAKAGKKRAAFLLCMTCVETSERYRSWEASPTEVVAREVTRRWSPGYSCHSHMDRDLFAVAALIEAHREEFDGYLEDLAQTTSLADRRRVRRAP